MTNRLSDHRRSEQSPTTAVVVVSVDRGVALRNALESAMRQSAPPVEIVVVAGPDEGKTRSVASEVEGVRIVDCMERNISSARNLGLLSVTADYVAFLDDDAIAEPDWIEALSAGLSEDAIQLVGGPVIDRTGCGYQVRYLMSDWHGDSEALATGSLHLDLRGLSKRNHARYPTALGASFMVKRRSVMELGGFDENFTYYLDETDLCARITDAGGVCYVVSRGAVHHKYLPSSTRDSSRNVVDWLPILRSRRYFALQHAAPRYGMGPVDARWREFVSKQRLIVHDSNAMGASRRKALNEFDEVVEVATVEALARAERGPNLPTSTAHGLTQTNRDAPLALEPIRSVVTIVAPPASPKGIGGIAHVVRALSTGLAKMNVGVRVLCEATADDGGDIDEVVQYDNGVFYFLYSRGLPRTQYAHLRVGLDLHQVMHLGPEYDRVNQWCQWLLEFTRTDAWVTQSWDGWAVAIPEECRPLAILAFTSAKTYIELDLAQDESALKSLSALESLAYTRAQVVIPDSHALRQDLIRQEPDLPSYAVSQACYPGMEGSPHKVAIREGALSRFGLFVGNCDPRKGLDWLLEAWESQLGCEDSWGLALVLNGLASDKRKALMRSAKENAGRLAIFETLSSESLHLLMESVGVVLLPSEYESFGFPIVEAWRLGKPVVARGRGAPRELLHDARLGSYVASCDPEDFVAAVDLELATDSGAKASFRRRHFSQEFTDTAAAMRFRNILVLSGILEPMP